MLAIIATGIAALHLFLVSLSVPIIKTIPLFRLHVDLSTGPFNVASNKFTIDFGVWGFCQSDVFQTSLFGLGQKSESSCSPLRIGYEIDSTAAHALQLDQLTGLVSKSLSAALILHLIAFVFAVVSLFILFNHRQQRQSSKYALQFHGKSPIIALGIAATLTTLIFIVDLVLIHTVGDAAHIATAGMAHTTYGAAFALTVVAVLLLWIALVRFVRSERYL